MTRHPCLATRMLWLVYQWVEREIYCVYWPTSSIPISRFASDLCAVNASLYLSIYVSSVARSVTVSVAYFLVLHSLRRQWVIECAPNKLLSTDHRENVCGERMRTNWARYYVIYLSEIILLRFSDWTNSFSSSTMKKDVLVCLPTERHSSERKKTGCMGEGQTQMDRRQTTWRTVSIERKSVFRRRTPI